jgi:hypothetical protein
MICREREGQAEVDKNKTIATVVFRVVDGKTGHYAGDDRGERHDATVITSD